MRCGEVRRKLEGYIAGVLDPGTARLMEAHIAACADCAAELRRAKRVWAALDDDGVPLPRAGFNRRIWVAIDATMGRRPASLRWRLAPALAIACATAAAGLLGTLSGREMARAIAPELRQEAVTEDWPTAALDRIPTTSLSGAYMELSGGDGT